MHFLFRFLGARSQFLTCGHESILVGGKLICMRSSNRMYCHWRAQIEISSAGVSMLFLEIRNLQNYPNPCSTSWLTCTRSLLAWLEKPGQCQNVGTIHRLIRWMSLKIIGFPYRHGKRRGICDLPEDSNVEIPGILAALTAGILTTWTPLG